MNEAEKFLTEQEKQEFLEFLKKYNLDDTVVLAEKLFTTPTTISTNLVRFARNTEKIRRTPRIWKALIEAQIENKQLKDGIIEIIKIMIKVLGKEETKKIIDQTLNE
jgi:hypothetical protein